MENNTSPFAFILKLPKEYHHFEYKSGSPVIIIKQKHNKKTIMFLVSISTLERIGNFQYDEIKYTDDGQDIFIVIENEKEKKMKLQNDTLIDL
ncbi:MAG: hypothetical protein K5860_08715 [Bacteroidales bacterium]|nr:hypothetical protein [Bacteroidales bacterium]MCR4800574.1 hypothetical protein [Bacteroidales bacterium]